MKTINLFILLFLTSIVSAKEADSIFFEDSSKLNHVEDILLDTSVSQATDDLSLGYINIEAFQGLKPDSYVYIKLPGYDQESTLLVNKIDHNIEGVITISGEVEGIENSTFIISTEKNKVLGSIKFNGFSYNIEPTSANDNRHVINKMDRFKLVQIEDDVVVKNTENKKVLSNTDFTLPQNEINRIEPAINNVRVLFLYGNDVNGNLLASQIITEFDNVKNRSSVSSTNRLVSAGTPQKLNTDFGVLTKHNMLARMDGKSYEFSDIDIRKNAANADIVVLLYSSSNNSNRLGGLANLYNSNFPNTVVADDYALGDLTAIHEIGHVLGGAHALPLRDDDADAFPLGHGVEGDNGLWQTIMGGYGHTCAFDFGAGATGQLCERIGYFSNENTSPLPPITDGQVIGNNTDADMAAVLNTTMPLAAQWGSYGLVNYSSPVKGFSYDPIKNGHGIQISQSGSDYYVYFHSYDQNGNPEWFYGVSTFANNQLSGTLNKVSYNFNASNYSSTQVGTFSLNYGLSQVNSNSNCDDVNRSLQPGVFNWNINGQNGAWCMRPLFNTGEATNTPSIPYSTSGLWYEPALDGWGMSLQTERRLGHITYLYRSYVVSYYYDSNGVGRWTAGLSQWSRSPTVFDFPAMDHVYGYPRNSFGTITTQNVGNLLLDLGPNKSADFNVTYPVSPGGSWNRNNATISHLTQ